MNSFYDFENEKKGQNGTVLIIGGSNLYTGAPYTSALSALLSGSDLAYIFSGKESITPLKILLPEAIVSEIIYEEFILKRINICILGPGLGKINEYEIIINKIIDFFNINNIPLIIDADGIRNINRLNISNYKNVIYTPNINERKYVEIKNENQYILYKGKTDTIISNDSEIEITDEFCKKRCGGQGDILNGILASLIIKLKIINKKGIIKSMCLSSKILRKSGVLAYKNKGVSTMTRDILEVIPDVMKNILK